MTLSIETYVLGHNLESKSLNIHLKNGLKKSSPLIDLGIVNTAVTDWFATFTLVGDVLLICHKRDKKVN